jgi:hypothetical protein
MLLLSPSSEMKEKYRGQIASGQATSKDCMFQLLYAGALSSIPLLFVKIYFLLVVSQTGLTLQNWISLVSGLIVVPQLIAQAAVSLRKERFASPDATPVAGDATLTSSKPIASVATNASKLIELVTKTPHASAPAPAISESAAAYFAGSTGITIPLNKPSHSASVPATVMSAGAAQYFASHGVPLIESTIHSSVRPEPPRPHQSRCQWLQHLRPLATVAALLTYPVSSELAVSIHWQSVPVLLAWLVCRTRHALLN